MALSAGSADAAPSAREGFLERTLNALNIAITAYDADDRLVYWNAAAETMFPAARDTLVLGIERRVRAQSLADHGYLHVRRFDADGDGHERKLPDGRTIRGRRYDLPDGGTVYEQIDVTADRSSEAKLASAMDRLQAGIAVYDDKLRLIHRNTRMNDLYPVEKPDELTGRSFAEIVPNFLSRLDGRTRDSIEPRLRAFLSGADDASELEAELRIGGRQVFARWIRLADGGLFTLHQDLSLQHSGNQRIRNALEHMPLGVIVFDAGGRLSFVNSRMAGFRDFLPGGDPIGMSYDEISSWRIQHLVRTDVSGERDRLAWAERHKKAFHERKSMPPYEVRSTHGQIARITSGHLPDGGTIYVHEDITEIATAEARLRLALEAMPVGVTIYDSADCVFMINSKVKELVPEIAGHDLVGLPVAAVWDLSLTALSDDPENAAFRTDAWRRARREKFVGRQIADPFELRTKSGRILRVTRAAEPTGWTVVVMEDVTAIRRAEERYRWTLENLPIGVMAFAEDNRVAIANPMVEALLGGVFRRSLIGAPYEDIVAAVRRSLRAEPRDGEPYSDEWLRERAQLIHARKPLPPYEIVDRDGRTLRVVPSPTRGGWTNVVVEDLTEIRRTEQRLRDAINAIDGWITMWGPDDRLVLWNRALEQRVPKISSVLVPGLPYLDFLKKSVELGYVDKGDAALLKPREIGVRIREGSGGRHIQTKQFATADGGFLLMTVDITAIKQAEQRLVEAISAFDGSFVLYDAEERLVICNEMMRRNLAPIAHELKPGLQFERQAALSWDAGLAEPEPGETREQWIARRIAIHRAKDGFTFDRHAHGRIFRVTKRPTAEGGVVAVGTDITELVQQRREIERLSEAEIAKRTRLLQLVLDNVETGLCVFTAAHNARFWNRRMQQIVSGAASRPSDLGAMRLGALLDLLQVDPGTQDALLIREISSAEVRVADGRHLRLRLIDAQGELLLAVRDQTAAKAEERERLELQSRLLQAQKVEAIGAMTGTIAHDFNNVLAVILGFSAMTRSQLAKLGDIVADLAPHPGAVQADAEKRLRDFLRGLGGALDNISSSANRGRELIESLAAYRGREGGQTSVTDIRDALVQIGKFALVAIPASVRFSVNLDPGPLVVRVNVGQLEQAVMNLCINAAQSLGDQSGEVSLEAGIVAIDGGRSSSLHRMGLGTGTREQVVTVGDDRVANLWIGTLDPGPHVRIAVSDTGCGMDEATISQIFEPLYTTKRQRGGTGLGLPSVRSVVAGHDGAIHVRSSVGVGSTFVVLLPVAKHRGPAADASAGVADPGDGGVTPSADEVRVETRVMVVDDEPGIIAFVSMLLTGQGFEVETFCDPKDAAARLRSNPEAFDLVLTDQTMPGLTGRALADLCATLRQNLPVIIMTGFSAESLDRTSLPHVIKAIARKPIAPQALLDLIREVLRDA